MSKDKKAKIRIVEATKARNSFQETIDKVHYTKERVIVRKHKKPWVVIKSLPQDDKEVKELIKRSKK